MNFPDDIIPRLLLGRSLVEAGRFEDAERTLRDAETEYVPAHDGLRNMNARMQDEIYKRYGRATGDRIGDAVYEKMTEWSMKDAAPTPYREQVESIAMLWHWHRTPFRMSEDADKITFSMEPCGSGGRMINEGAYAATSARPLMILEDASPASFSQPQFPSWCTHCAFSNRAFLRRGLSFFYIEGWTPERHGGNCVTHAYKRLSAIPQSVAARVGETIPRREEQAVEKKVFTAAELAEMARPAVERITEAVRRADARAAIDLIDRSWLAWLSLHHAYRCWYAFFYRSCRAEFGEHAADELLRESAWELIAPTLEREPAAPESWLKFWRSHGERVSVEQGSAETLFIVDQAAIVHPGLEQPQRHRFAPKLAEAITIGAARHGYQLGTLSAPGSTFEHRQRIDSAASG